MQNTASNVIVQIHYNEHVGYGEAAPDEYYGENQETVLACIICSGDALLLLPLYTTFGMTSHFESTTAAVEPGPPGTAPFMM